MKLSEFISAVQRLGYRYKGTVRYKGVTYVSFDRVFHGRNVRILVELGHESEPQGLILLVNPAKGELHNNPPGWEKLGKEYLSLFKAGWGWFKPVSDYGEAYNAIEELEQEFLPLLPPRKSVMGLSLGVARMLGRVVQSARVEVKKKSSEEIGRQSPLLGQKGLLWHAHYYHYAHTRRHELEGEGDDIESRLEKIKRMMEGED